MDGLTIWFTGLSGSGKTTIADELVERLRNEEKGAVLLDGDIVRKTLSADLGYTKEDRDKHITRIAHVCALITENGIPNIACVISPTKKIRDYARLAITNFIEVYVHCPIEICEQRDVKGHYERVRKGEIKDFVGITIPYEEPSNPEIIVSTDKMAVSECVDKIMNFLVIKGYLRKNA